MMMPDSDTPTVLFSNTSTQWRSAILATVAVSRFRRSQTLAQTARHQGLEAPEQEPDIQQNVSINENGDVRKQASHNEEAKQATQLPTDVLDKTLKDKNPEVEVLKLIRDDLVKQLDAYGIVLVLLAGITFVAILQPPGSFDNGKLESSVLVAFFMLLATLSFFIACTGLLAVMVGCAQLFRPVFYTKLASYTDVRTSERLLSSCLPAETLSPNLAALSLRKWCLGFCKVGPDNVAFDNTDLLGKVCVDNVYRVMRIRLYLGLALVLCIAAYICGALAVMANNVLQRYMLVGAMGAGGVILLYEICKTMSAAMQPVTKSNDRSLHKSLHHFTMQRRETHPQIQIECT